MLNTTGNRGSISDLDGSPGGKRERKNFARGIQLENDKKKDGSKLRHLQELAPSAHHRFDKEQVHLRYMYRQLHPSEMMNSRNSTGGAGAQYELLKQGSTAMIGADYHENRIASHQRSHL